MHRPMEEAEQAHDGPILLAHPGGHPRAGIRTWATSGAHDRADRSRDEEDEAHEEQP